MRKKNWLLKWSALRIVLVIWPVKQLSLRVIPAEHKPPQEKSSLCGFHLFISLSFHHIVVKVCHLVFVFVFIHLHLKSDLNTIQAKKRQTLKLSPFSFFICEMVSNFIDLRELSWLSSFLLAFNIRFEHHQILKVLTKIKQNRMAATKTLLKFEIPSFFKETNDAQSAHFFRFAQSWNFSLHVTNFFWLNLIGICFMVISSLSVHLSLGAPFEFKTWTNGKTNVTHATNFNFISHVGTATGFQLIIIYLIRVQKLRTKVKICCDVTKRNQFLYVFFVS